MKPRLHVVMTETGFIASCEKSKILLELIGGNEFNNKHLKLFERLGYKIVQQPKYSSKLKQFRVEGNIYSQEFLADYIGVSLQKYKRLESGASFLDDELIEKLNEIGFYSGTRESYKLY